MALTDLTLLDRARQGDRRVLCALFERHYLALLASRRMLQDADLARDAAQEAVVRAMLGLEQLRDDERFGAWLIGIGVNVCRSLLSQERSRPTSSAQALAGEHTFAEWAEPQPTPAERVMRWSWRAASARPSPSSPPDSVRPSPSSTSPA